MALPAANTRYLFFTGKGGVGKTSLSCASALALAQAGRRVLIVSTDPASNLDEVLGAQLTQAPGAIPGAPGLYALNIDPEAAAAAYRERMVAPYRNVLPAAALRSMEEQFSGGCTVEIAAFDEFSKLLGDAAATAEFDHVVFDTAPTGHTLRLLSLPSAWRDFIASSSTGASCLGPLAGLAQQQALYAATVAQLTDAQTTSVVLVARAEAAALREAERTRVELQALGISNLQLCINGLFDGAEASSAARAGDRVECDDAVARAMAQRSQAALERLPAGLAALPRVSTPYLPAGTVGLAALRALALPRAVVPPATTDAPVTALPPGLGGLIEEIARAGRGVVMTLGKGGVGKTSVAAALALALAARGQRVCLSTTDPAAHLAAALDSEEGERGLPPGLSLARIDPAREVALYAEEVLARARGELDAAALALLEEDLRSPCTEEIAVFRAFARTVDAGRDGFVVLDTAPTGHTLLLLDAAEAYHREVLRTRGEMPQAVRELLPRLRDPDYTRVLIVTLAEATPVHEAQRLQDDLLRAGITPFAWVINQSLLASGSRDPLLQSRASCELPFIRQVVDTLAARCALIPWQVLPPNGAAGLAQMAR